MTGARYRRWVLAFMLLAPPGVASAQSPPAAGPASPASPAQPGGPVLVETTAGTVTVLADRLEEFGPERLLVATGNVELTHGTARLLADRVELNRDTGDAVAEGQVVFYDGENELRGRRIEYNMRSGTGVVHDADARAAPYYRLRGERMDRLGDNLYRIQGGSFTTCEDDPPFWSFRFGNANADLEDLVTGTGASFWIRNFPLIPFFPFFAAPVRRERQSGFLMPKWGTSTTKGFFFEAPFYWAISPSQDATVALDVYERRGIGGSAEYRYVLSETNRGIIRGWYLNQFVSTEQSTGPSSEQQRAVGSARHEWRITPTTTFKADINMVSDDNVFRDYGDPLPQRAQQRTDSNVWLARRWPTWDLIGNAFWYQDLTVNRPVELNRLPEVQLFGSRQPLPFAPAVLYDQESSLTRFVRELGSDGTRFDLHPRLSRPFSPGGLVTITPFIGTRLTAYDKTVTGSRTTSDNIVIEETKNEPRIRPLVEAGADVELTASRLYRLNGWGGYDAVLHTIEPRVNYTWITGDNLSHLPQWTEGIDRILDTSLITYSLTNRLRGRTVAPEGTEPVRLELLRLVLEETYDVRNRTFGDLAGDLLLQPRPGLYFRSTATYSLEARGIDFNTNDIAVTLPWTTAALGTRYSRPERTQFIQGSLTSEVARRFVIRSATNVDARTGTFVDTRFALDVRFQCFVLTAEYIRRFQRDDEIRFGIALLGVGGPFSTSVGLGALGLQNTTQR
jgi:LPS-assembly protein